MKAIQLMTLQEIDDFARSFANLFATRVCLSEECSKNITCGELQNITRELRLDLKAELANLFSEKGFIKKEENI